MKKIIIFLLLFISFSKFTYAINGDLLVNKFGILQSGQSNNYIIPDGYDFYLESSSIQNSGTSNKVSLQATDNGVVIFAGDFEPGTTTNQGPRIYRDNLLVQNLGSGDFSFSYYGFLFLEGTNVGLGSENNISENGGIIPQEEFLRQDELFQWYELEFTILLLLTLIIMAKKFGFQKQIKASDFKF